MKHLNLSGPLGRSLLVSVCATGMIMSACSEMSAKPEKQSEGQTCGNLKSVIADHPNQFSHYRKNLSMQTRLNIWTAKKMFPSAENCQVWDGVRDFITMFANGQQETMKTRLSATSRKV